MRIALINGSPKAKNSTGSILLEELEEYLGENAEVIHFGVHSPTIREEVIEELSKIDVWVFASPLYLDGIPGHLLSCLMQLEKACIQKRIHIYGIVNCGFYEGIQAELALRILQNWCYKVNFVWRGGIGVGGGEGLAMMPKQNRGHGPKVPIDRALEKLSNTIIKGEEQANDYVSVAFPRFFYKIAGQMRWRRMIKENGGKARDLGKKPKRV